MTSDSRTVARGRPTPLRAAVWGGAALLWLLPMAAMQVSDEMNWTVFDFAVWGAMLLAACAAFEVAMRMSGHWAYRAGAALAIGTAFLLVWINLAVGVIGSENNSANLLYAGVLAIGVVGAVVGGFKPKGMARTLFAMAGAQVLIGAAALIAGWGSDGENWPQVIIVVNGFFAALWLLSGGLFQRAGREPVSAAA